MSESVQRLLEELRNDARQAEQQLDVQLGRLEELACVSDKTVRVSDSPELVSGALPDNNNNNNGHMGSSSSGGAQLRERRPLLREVQQRFAEVQREVEHALRRYGQLVQSMTELCSDMPPTSSAVRHTERLQSVLHEKWQQLERVRGDFVRRSERLELLPRVHKDVKRYEEAAGLRSLMGEQQSLRHTQARVGVILEQAQHTHAQLRSQRERFASMTDKLTTLIERVPVIQTVLGRIHARRRRNAVVVGVVLALCIFVTFLAW